MTSATRRSLRRLEGVPLTPTMAVCASSEMFQSRATVAAQKTIKRRPITTSCQNARHAGARVRRFDRRYRGVAIRYHVHAQRSRPLSDGTQFAFIRTSMRHRNPQDRRCTYVIGIERAGDPGELAQYLSLLSLEDCEVVIVDGSTRAAFEENRRVLRWVGRHVAPNERQ